MWEPQHLTTLWASMACYRDSLTLQVKGGEQRAKEYFDFSSLGIPQI
jgi:hypothetical protein